MDGLTKNRPTPDQEDTVISFSAQPSSQSFLQGSLYPITLKFEEIGYRVKLGEERGSYWGGNKGSPKERTILNGVTGMVFPGEMLAMLGPSGSGKTTLLSALGGRLSGKLSGKISYNAQPFSSTVKRKIAFVSQDDTFYPHLTVAETLVFTALLRLPKTLTEDQKLQQVDRVITELGLGRCRNSMIGGPFFRGISGGERKRVSIGQEMLINPSLLLLDEPTSGLDSTTAQRIISTVKRLAGGGRAVVTTIHQPSSRLYYMFDKILLLSEGRPLYYGLASAACDYFASLGFSASISVNPADLLLDLANGIIPDQNNNMTEESDFTDESQKSVKAALVSAYENKIEATLKDELCSSDAFTYNLSKDANSKDDMKMDQWCTSWWYEFTVLLRRGMKERRFDALNVLKMSQVIAVAVLGGLLWWQTPTSHIADRVALVFFFSCFWGFYPLYNAVFTFPQERGMLMKERSSRMYRLSSYFLARTMSDLPLELALPTVFVFIMYWMGGLKSDVTSFILSLLVTLYSVLVAQSLGLAFGAMLMEVKKATTLASVTTLVFLIAGGYYVQHIPSFMVWLKYLSYSYYCFKLLLGVQYDENDSYECSAGVQCRVGDYSAIKAVGLDNNWGIDVSVMTLMLMGYRLIAYFALRKMRVL